MDKKNVNRISERMANQTNIHEILRQIVVEWEKCMRETEWRGYVFTIK